MRFLRWFTQNIPSVLTALVVLLGVILSWHFTKLEELNQVGGFVAGLSGALAFIWLVAGYRLQSHELRLQREELSLQRASLDAQREELQKMGKYAALEQMSKIMTQFDESLSRLPEGSPQSILGIPDALTEGVNLWKTILDSQDPQQVYELHLRWQRIVSPAQEFLARLLSAIDLYEEATGKKLVTRGDDPAIRVYVSIDAIRDIPLIRNYAGTAELVATALFTFQPGLDAIALKGFEATETLLPGLVRQDALQALRKKVKANELAQAAAKDA